MTRALAILLLMFSISGNAAVLSPKASSVSIQPMVRVSAMPSVIKAPPTKYSLALAWNESPGAASYRLYYGAASRAYTNSVTSNTTTAVVQDLSDATDYYFAATALNQAGVESDFSNEVTTAPPKHKTIRYFIDIGTNASGPWAYFTNVLTVTDPTDTKFLRLNYSVEYFY